MSKADDDPIALSELPQSAADLSDEELLGVLNGQTAEVPWQVLARYFAQGRLLRLASEADLLAAGIALIRDDANTVQSLMGSDQLASLSDSEAKEWQEGEQQLWALVIAPWVLVQSQSKS